MNKPKNSLFKHKSRNHGTVVLNPALIPSAEFTFYGNAFHDAGKALVQELKNDERFGLCDLSLNSFKALPILYMYRHALELYLKGIIVAGAGVLPLRYQGKIDLRDILNTHSLRRVLPDVERIFNAFELSWDFGLPRFGSLAHFRSIVSEIEDIDPGSLTFRYPTQKDGKSPSLKDCVRFNIFEFCETLDPVYAILDEKAFAVSAQLKIEHEMRAEASTYKHFESHANFAEEVEDILHRVDTLPTIEDRTDDEILGYSSQGIPH
jgi:hypothetical protein